jgi:23S rRNA (cytosine1962-C5)-methyltransferase
VTPVRIPQRVVDRLGRTCEVPLGLFEPGASHAHSDLIALQSADGRGFGCAVIDREAACLRLMTRGDEPFAALDTAWAARRLDTAFALRSACGLTGRDRAFRLLNGAGDATPGVLADVYGAWAVISVLSSALEAPARTLAETFVARGPGQGAVVKARGRGQGAAGPGALDLVGVAPPERVLVSEGPWRFEVHLTTGVNVGLFTDMRDERQRVRGIASGARVLNLFAYTGALSVAALAGGAASVTSVDLSEGVLAWARDHVALNGLDAGRHHTVARDAATYVDEARRAGARFDLVLVDPPSYSSARGAAFAIDRDYPALLAGLVDLVGDGGYLWAAANTRGFALTGALQHAVASHGRQAVVVGVGGLPADYPTELADVEARYLQTCLLCLG